ncbi:PAB-dependent poly(A)-specific ribonuclease subunit 3 [Pseudocyphellaria aurata]|nr:PAB-dependent poly(A)-specific ribonuclease subunit 3 [Pseudocyphellaria aurata]
MATVAGIGAEDARRPISVPRPKPRGEPLPVVQKVQDSKDVACKNVGIYGYCRYADKGCLFNHDITKVTPPRPESSKLGLNVESPSFTPSSLVVNGNHPPPKTTRLSPKAVNAAIFKPKGSTPAPTAPIFTPSAKPYNPSAPDWVAPDVQEYVPSYNNLSIVDNSHETSHDSPFDFIPQTSTPNLPSTSHTPQPPNIPYVQETNSMTYYQGNNFSQPLQHHLYAALGPHREGLRPNQRTARDLFIPEDLRQTLQRRSETTLSIFQNSTLPPSIAHFHSLVPLVHNTQKNVAMFGLSSWAYKAVSSQNGKTYCLRRLQGYHLANEADETAVRNVQLNWKPIRSGNIVTVHLAFTNSSFGDSSLIFVTDYHPVSETLAQRHFAHPSRFARPLGLHITEDLLWSYMVQIANALKTIHSHGQAARLIDPSKVILTGENRIRLNACAILDVVQHDKAEPLHTLQRLDLYQLGRLILVIATNNLYKTDPAKAIDTFNRSFTPNLRERVSWLLDHKSSEKTGTIDVFLSSIAVRVTAAFDASLNLNDQLNTDLARELENSRLVRLLTKLNFLNERPEYEHDRQWNEQGSRYILQLFRDYVFHQVNSQGKPVLDLAHVLSCLNKLDAGIEEKITLTARDENTLIIVSYREVRSTIEMVWGELMRKSM